MTNRRTISFSVSTSSIGTGPSLTVVLNVIRPRNIDLRVASWFVCFEKRQYASSLLVRAATCSSAIAVGIPHVAIAAFAPMEVAGVRQYRQRDHVAARIAERVPALQFLREHVETDALHAARGAGEAALDDVVGEADRFEDLRAFVRLQRRDAHLRHDLQDAFGGGFAIGVHDVVVAFHVRRFQRAVGTRLPQRLRTRGTD